MAYLEVKGLKKSFGNNRVLRGVDFVLERGRTLTLVGASGNGKTTLLRCLTLLETPDSGTVTLGETTVNFGEDKKSIDSKINAIRGKIGLVFQNFNLFPQYTAFENVLLPLKLYENERRKKGLPPLNTSDESRAKEILCGMGLNDKLDLYPCQLSGGQQQRVAISRAIALEPTVLCFDEPTSALDPALSDEVAKLINSLKNIAVIVVTHDLSFAKKISDIALEVSDGVVKPVQL